MIGRSGERGSGISVLAVRKITSTLDIRLVRSEKKNDEKKKKKRKKGRIIKYPGIGVKRKSLVAKIFYFIILHIFSLFIIPNIYLLQTSNTAIKMIFPK